MSYGVAGCVLALVSQLLHERRDYGVSSEAEGRNYYSLGEYAVTTGGGVDLRLAVVDVWLEGGSIYVAFDEGEEFVELDAKVIVGVRKGRVADVEILLGREGVERLRKLLRP